MSRRAASKFLLGKSISDKHEIIFKELNFNINDLPTKYKRGFCIERKTVKVPVSELPKESQKYIRDLDFIERNKLVVDLEIPLFNKDHNYIEKHITQLT